MKELQLPDEDIVDLLRKAGFKVVEGEEETKKLIDEVARNG